MTITSLIRRSRFQVEIRRTIQLLIMIPICLQVDAQITGSVIDSISHRKIAYANIWIDGEEIGTSSNTNGDFFLEGNHLHKTLVVSAIGFTKTKMVIISPDIKIHLTPIAYPIRDAIISVPKGKRELTLYTYKKSQVINYFAPVVPVIFAQYINCLDSNDIFFIKSIKLESLSKINSKINLRFLEVGLDGKPGDDLITQNLIIDVKRGKTSLEISNLIEHQIRVDRAGLFVAIEFLIIPENQAKLKAKNVNSGEKQIVYAYMPFIGSRENYPDSEALVYHKGDWSSEFGIIKEDDKPRTIALEVKIQN
jgi:hypothetical protein